MKDSKKNKIKINKNNKKTTFETNLTIYIFYVTFL